MPFKLDPIYKLGSGISQIFYREGSPCCDDLWDEPVEWRSRGAIPPWLALRAVKGGPMAVVLNQVTSLAMLVTDPSSHQHEAALSDEGAGLVAGLGEFAQDVDVGGRTHIRLSSWPHTTGGACSRRIGIIRFHVNLQVALNEFEAIPD